MIRSVGVECLSCLVFLTLLFVKGGEVVLKMSVMFLCSFMVTMTNEFFRLVKFCFKLFSELSLFVPWIMVGITVNDAVHSQLN